MSKTKSLKLLIVVASIITFLPLIVSDFSAYSQNGAAINITGAAADPSAMLDVSSDNAGILIPRMTEYQKGMISQPATGLMIYQTDGVQGFWYFNGTSWSQSVGVAGSTGATGPDGAVGATGSTGLLSPGASAGNTPYWDGTQWVVNSSNIFNNGGSVGIGTSNPHSSASFEISSTTGGALIPRMITAERNAIQNPAQGLQIYNITTRCFEYYEYGIWQQWHCATCSVPGNPDPISGQHNVCQGDSDIIYDVAALTNATSYFWYYSGSGATINGTSNSVTIDFAANATSGYLTVQGKNHCGDGILSSNYSITVNSPPSSPSAGTHTPFDIQIIWNWNTVSGATGYKYNTVNDYSTANDNGSSTSYVQTGLTCNTLHTLYVWAYASCGNSSTTILNQTTSACFACGTNVTFTYNGASVTYGSVNGGYNSGQYCWLDRNHGATIVATAYNHAAGYGDLFQWGRLDDGHQIRTSGTTSILSNNNTPGHSNFIITSASPNDWRSPQENSLWQGASGINNPCPVGWRLPTETEFNNELSSWSENNRNGAISSPTRFTAAGFRFYNGTTFYYVGTEGRYWSSTVSSTSARYLRLNSTEAITGNYHRANGFSVRCIWD